MKEIEKLEDNIFNAGHLVASIEPSSNKQLMDKINEIIDYLNQEEPEEDYKEIIEKYTEPKPSLKEQKLRDKDAREILNNGFKVTYIEQPEGWTTPEVTPKEGDEFEYKGEKFKWGKTITSKPDNKIEKWKKKEWDVFYEIGDTKHVLFNGEEYIRESDIGVEQPDNNTEEKKERKCMKCGRVAKNGESLNSNWDGSYIVCDDCMWGIEKDGTRLADEFYSLAPRYRTKVKLQEMIDKWLDKAREEVFTKEETKLLIRIVKGFRIANNSVRDDKLIEDILSKLKDK